VTEASPTERAMKLKLLQTRMS